MMKQSLLVFFFLTLVFYSVHAEEFVVITFSEKKPSPGLFQKSFERRTNEYLWIIPIDSLSCENIPINPFVIDWMDEYVEKGPEAFYWLDIINYPSSMFSELDSLYSIIRDNRILIQSFSYSFRKTQEKRSWKVTVYATPIRGIIKKTISSHDGRVVFYSKDYSYQDTQILTEELFSKLCCLGFFRIPYDEMGKDPGLYIPESSFHLGN